uniref:DNA-directed RNA polymerase II subunit RPB9-like zinc ribbon domain-containing protein n=1 Tax=Chelonoidis abingdonii TaxID=106734 RepID=A0A8C0IRG6_CHEAB
MLLFCPACGNVLVAEEGARCHRFACTTCPYVRNVTRKVSSRKYPKLKEVDDVLGGAAAWENVDSTAGEYHPRGSAGDAWFGCCQPLLGILQCYTNSHLQLLLLSSSPSTRPAGAHKTGRGSPAGAKRQAATLVGPA